MAEHVSSDKTMAKWPRDLNRARDIITPYPCQTCRLPFRSVRLLRTHDCKPNRSKAAVSE